MKWPTPESLRQFVEFNNYPGISIYMPTQITGQEIRQNPIRLKNLILKGRDILKETYPQEKADEILKFAWDLQSNTNFWQHQNRGLAIFITPEFAEYIQLCIEPKTNIYVGNYLHILPLIPTFVDDGVFYLLALSQHRITLYEASHHSINEIELTGIPQNIEELLRFDIAEGNIQARGLPAGSISGPGTMYHGYANTKLEKRNLERFVQIIAHAVDKKLFNKNSPLVIAAVDNIESLFRLHSSHPYLVSKSIHGNPDIAKISSLHQQAWNIIIEYILKNYRKYMALYRDFSETDKTSSDFKTILNAAAIGKIDTLFINIDEHKYGSFNSDTFEFEIHNNHKRMDDEDLFNLAAVYTLKNEGRAFPILEKLTDQNEKIAAIFRY